MTRREVKRSVAFLERARELFPDESADGDASFSRFQQLVLPAVEAQFARQFDDLPVAIADVDAIRFVMTHAVPFFPALVVYGLLVGDVIELIDIDIDDDYFDLIADDPTD